MIAISYPRLEDEDADVRAAASQAWALALNPKPSSLSPKPYMGVPWHGGVLLPRILLFSLGVS